MSIFMCSDTIYRNRFLTNNYVWHIHPMFVYHINIISMNNDIQYCKGAGCLLRESCRRAKDDFLDGEVWFADEPFRIVDKKFHCDLYWQDTQMNIFEQTNEANDEQEAGKDKRIDEAERTIGGEAIGDSEATS